MGQDSYLERELCEIGQFPLPWDNLKGAKILCTGATGFIGNYLVKILSGLSDRKNLDLDLWLFRRPGSSERIHAPNIHWIEGNIEGEFLPEGPAFNIIIHAASPANARAMQADPTGLIHSNILAVRYLLERAKKDGSVFVFFSSAMVYGTQRMPMPELELSTLIKNDLKIYGASKLAGELLCEEYHQKFGVGYRVIRPFNIHGPGDSLDCGRFFPDFLRQALRNGEVVVTGTGTLVRDSCYLMDLASGLLYALLEGENTAYNIGNEDNSCTILEFAQQIAAQSGGLKVVGPLSLTSQMAGDVLVPDTSKLRRLGWRPQIDLQTCIRRCLDSYRIEGELK